MGLKSLQGRGCGTEALLGTSQLVAVCGETVSQELIVGLGCRFSEVLWICLGREVGSERGYMGLCGEVTGLGSSTLDSDCHKAPSNFWLYI